MISSFHEFIFYDLCITMILFFVNGKNLLLMGAIYLKSGRNFEERHNSWKSCLSQKNSGNSNSDNKRELIVRDKVSRAVDRSVLNSSMMMRKERAWLLSLLLRVAPVLYRDRRKCSSDTEGKRRQYNCVKSVEHAFGDPDQLEGKGFHGKHNPVVIFSPREPTAGLIVFTHTNLEERLPGF